MDGIDFEGTAVLEKLAEVHAVDDFLDAVDSDNFALAAQIMRSADLDSRTIAIVLQKMRNGDDE